MKKYTTMHELKSSSSKSAVMAMAKKHGITIEEGINTLWADAPDGHSFKGTQLHSVTAYYDGCTATKGQAWALLLMDIIDGVEVCNCEDCNDFPYYDDLEGCH